MSTGLLDHLMHAHPQARFTVAVGRVAEGVFRRMPALERIIPIEKKRFGLHWLGLWSQVAFRRWDLVVDLRGSAIAWLLAARRRAVMRGGRRPGHRLLHIAQTLGVSPAPRPVAWFGPEEAARAETLVPPGGPVLALGPTANWARKVWPADRFLTLARLLTGPGGALEGARIVVLGGPGEQERAMAAPVLEGLLGAVDLVGALDLPEAAAVLARCALFVGNDSGLMHLSAATGTPTIGLFGPTPASEYAPVGMRALAVLAKGPRGAAPMGSLSATRVAEEATALLARPEPVPLGEVAA
nr:glycosyltransferase family 9 protein [Neoroseomonas soli]